MPTKVSIIENSLIAKLAARKLKTQNMAITLGHKIRLHHVSKEVFLKDIPWLCHELRHVAQFRQHGFLTFIIKYLWESLQKGYYNNKWEIEARNAENDSSILNDFKIG
jgi:hypothetical protein